MVWSGEVEIGLTRRWLMWCVVRDGCVRKAVLIMSEERM